RGSTSSRSTWSKRRPGCSGESGGWSCPRSGICTAIRRPRGEVSARSSSARPARSAGTSGVTPGGVWPRSACAGGRRGRARLVALTRDGQDEAVIARTREAIEARSGWSSSERVDHLAVLWFVAEAEHLPVKVMQAYFTEEQLMESELYRSIIARGEAKAEVKV